MENTIRTVNGDLRPGREQFMQLILVIENVDLWIVLNRHFAGSDSVQVSETPTWKTGIRYAKAHSPALIICNPRDGERTASELRADLDQAGLESTHFLCVQDPKSVLDSAIENRPLLTLCRPDKLIEIVKSLLVTGTTEADPPALVDLLAHYELTTGQPGEPQRGFVNLLEIHLDSLVFESNQALHAGDHLELTFFLPRPQLEITTTNRLKISLGCEVGPCVDEGKLRYRGDVKSLEAKFEDALRNFVESRRSQGKGAA